MLNLNQRDLLSKSLMDAGKLSLATLVFGQFVKREPVNVFIFLFGATATIASYYIAVKILKEDQMETAMLTVFITVFVLSIGAYIADRLSRKKAR